MTSIDVDDIDRFTSRLSDIEDAEPKVMKKAYGKVASYTQSRARSNASQAGGTYQKAKTAIRGYSDPTSASIGVNKQSSNPFAQGTFYGALGRFGWYAAAKYAESEGRQFDDWVGTNWRSGVTGEGPYVINYTVDEETPQIVEKFGDAMVELFGPAFE